MCGFMNSVVLDNPIQDQDQPVQSATFLKIMWEIFYSIERSLIMNLPFKSLP